MPAPAPTLRSLARLLGLSRTTVSDALRGSPRVDPNTAVRVKKAAREAGYRRNPLAGALMSELRRSRGAAFRGVLAAIDFNEPERPDAGARFHRELVLGAETRATELGFKVEKFLVGHAGVSVQRLDSILQSRGIHGVILLPSWAEPDLSKLDWSQYAGIYTDYIIERPALHSVCSDHYRSLLAARSCSIHPRGSNQQQPAASRRPVARGWLLQVADRVRAAFPPADPRPDHLRTQPLPAASSSQSFRAVSGRRTG